MYFGWFLIIFLLFAVGERAYARRFSRRAIRGLVKIKWSGVALDVLHTIIYVGTGAEYFLFRQNIHWLVTAIGLSLYCVSVIVRHVAIRTLGKFWSLQIEIRPDHNLVREGIYRYVRHPAYSSIILEVIAIPLTGNSYYTLALALFAYIPVLLTRWRREEREMIEKFGKEYVQYRQNVSALLPLKWLSKS